jgi:hypothetical protein
MTTNPTTIIYPQSKARADVGDVVLNPAWAHRTELYVFCLQHRQWNQHGLATTTVFKEEDGTTFAIDESTAGTITGRHPHHQHAGEFWICCNGFAPLDLRKILSNYRRSQKIPPSAQLLAASAKVAADVLHQLQIKKMTAAGLAAGPNGQQTNNQSIGEQNA